VSKGIIGEQFTFTVLFLDGTNQPTDVLNPTIEVFYFTDAGQRTYLVAAGTFLPQSFPVETGRYAYTMQIPTTLESHQELYGIMRGTDPITADPYVIEQQVDLFSGEVEGGMRASFIKAGIC
jgi:hypothetical protein